MKSANATVHGAISIVNAIASGNGSALGISLKVNAEVEFTEGNGITFEPKGEFRDDKLIRAVVNNAVPKKILEQYNVKVNVNSEIPVGYGLKSSSAVSNAVSLACLKIVKENIDDLDVVNTAVDASFDAKVTITGAFDDACASYFGGFVITNNLTRELIRHEKVSKDLYAIILIPNKSERDDPLRLRILSKFFDDAFDLARNTEYWEAMMLNGILVSAGLTMNYKPIKEAVENGALAASVSGNGPALAAVAYEWRLDNIVKCWNEYDGKVIIAKVNNEKAMVVG
ncbi:MAG: shikimate kinase [Thaumarchaeota archaeon]|nr:shikimate kinase [Nitrososphaerota archaeon]